MGDKQIPTTPSMMPNWLPRFNKATHNRLQKYWAPYVPPWALVVHCGRKSGRIYQTPVMALRKGGSIAIVLLYGSDSDWVRNVLAAAGDPEVRYRGRQYRLTEPRIVTDPADPALPWMARRVVPRLGVLVAGLG
ncbi:nitroreductase family deazaflavin-dependent oxidoreductase [Rhodococcus sp. D2-41]|uniref:Nitroreductase family deazaflavin-dependent oxidoreductase n=1 Tax=Speluncibacter jeojiensis TaxID=2710754 RepID=A0A9X4LXD2_9ACTN|nr:nitroreductase family deazaflavin-dependent oxidoreductase [Rhodococcus sp. D2-41]MDG3010364.1 nitroreductase family deazaflavin-dependent oxidoreductase [Rhodococcus sp. D2-41]MDG3014100.1 nitroreductase family deazaflavin-dependent oxidoreductase [Corynebacteriales bacterium D3-21]